MKGLTLMFVVMIASMLIASAWNAFPVVKDSVHAVLDPTAGWMLNLNLFWGMTFFVLIITFITVLLQKYATDQASLKKLKEEQKILQEEMKKYKDSPEKLLELQKKSFEFMPKTMDLTMKPIIYTAVPFVLFFRWFQDYFANVDYKFLGFLSWFWFYFLLSIVFNSILRKVMKVH